MREADKFFPFANPCWITAIKKGEIERKVYNLTWLRENNKSSWLASNKFDKIEESFLTCAQLNNLSHLSQLLSLNFKAILTGASAKTQSRQANLVKLAGWLAA